MWTLAQWRTPILLASVAIGIAGLGGCASTSGADDDPAEDQSIGPQVALGRGELAVSVRYQRTAEGNWKRGNAAFEDEEYLAAQRYFQYIRTKFPYSRFAPMSEVRIGDCQFERQRWLEAIDTYQSFVRTRPTHAQVPYAMYRTALGYYEQIPGDFFMLPPSHEKDQTAVRDASRKLSEYVRRFPKDKNFADGKEKLDEVRKRLMAHERYVADFYRGLDRDRAYAGRLEVIRRDFADVGLSDELLLEIVEVWSRVGELDKAKNAAAQLAKDFPKAKDSIEEAQQFIIAATPKPSPEDESTSDQKDDATSDKKDDPAAEESGGS